MGVEVKLQQILQYIPKQRFGGINPPRFQYSPDANPSYESMQSQLGEQGVKMRVRHDLPPALNFRFVPLSTLANQPIGYFDVRPEYLANIPKIIERDAHGVSGIFSDYNRNLQSLRKRIIYTDLDFAVLKVKDDSEETICNLPRRIASILDNMQYGPRIQINDFDNISKLLERYQETQNRQIITNFNTPFGIYLKLLQALSLDENKYDPMSGVSVKVGSNDNVPLFEILGDTDEVLRRVELEDVSTLFPIMRGLSLQIFGIDQMEAIETFVGYNPLLPLEQQSIDVEKIDSIQYYWTEMDFGRLKPQGFIPLSFAEQLPLIIEQLPVQAVIKALNKNTGLIDVRESDYDSKPFQNSDGSKFYPGILTNVFLSARDIDVFIEIEKQQYHKPFGAAHLNVGLSRKNLNSLIRDRDLQCVELITQLNNQIIEVLSKDERLKNQDLRDFLL